VVIFAVGTGVRAEEAFGADWTDVDRDEGILRVRRTFAKGRLKTYTKTERVRRRVPLRAKAVEALERPPGRRGGVLFPNSVGGRIDIENWRIYDMRHTFATWSLDLRPPGARCRRRRPRLLDAYDQAKAGFGHVAGTRSPDENPAKDDAG
jgi:integrase